MKRRVLRTKVELREDLMRNHLVEETLFKREKEIYPGNKNMSGTEAGYPLFQILK